MSMLLLCAAALIGGPVVTDGKAQAVVVVGKSAGPVARYAAEELVAHVEKATGARLEIVPEDQIPPGKATKIHVGDSQAVRDAGIKVEELGSEVFRIKTDGNELFIAGEDGAGDPLSRETHAGTLWGVYEWLERTLKVRWLWPGDLGTHVPKARTVVTGTLNEMTAPRLVQRKLRPGPGMNEPPRTLGFTPAAQEKYARDENVFLRRHRMGATMKLVYSHAFTDWWDRFGADHPEWFQLTEDGKRGPAKQGGRFSMCMSNKELHKQIVEEWKQARIKDPSMGRALNACENDILGLCVCDGCKAWDGPVPDDFTNFIAPGSKIAGSRFVSDRNAKFLLAIQKELDKADGHAVVVGYAYMNYFVAPTSGVELNPNIWIGFCPSGSWYPRSPEDHAWIKRQWSGWAATGARLFFRPNYFLSGHCMPNLFTRAFADEFHHAVKSGIVATDFDSLTGQWSTQGTNLYLLSRLHTRPDAGVDDVLGEYFEAFGPAAPHVKEYFEYWEKHTGERRERTAAALRERKASYWRSYARLSDVAFPLESFAPAEALLKKAKAAAASNEEAARVAFLAKGLDHAKLCVRVAGLFASKADGAEVKRALDELVAFRRASEGDYISNFTAAAWVEGAAWALPAEYR